MTEKNQQKCRCVVANPKSVAKFWLKFVKKNIERITPYEESQRRTLAKANSRAFL